MSCLKEDELDALLDNHFGLDKLADDKRRVQADGCTIASLLLMNAAMLHQRIADGAWLPKISGLETIKNEPDAIMEISRQWNCITRHDFLPVVEPAIDIIDEVQRSGKRTGLNRALRHLAGEAERIAESYADLGADHAGPLFNKVMGNQASDGAFFTRPPAASLLARLALDTADTGQDADWTNDWTWSEHRTVDLACGSGTLIAAMLTDMKRRAEDQGANDQRLAELQKLAVEEVISGLDFNEVSLQLAAAQLTAGNRDVAYRKIGLHRMPYGPIDGSARVGTLELLGQRSVLRSAGFEFEDEDLNSQQIRMRKDDPMLDSAAAAVQNVRIVIMNPPFTNRSKMGEKFPIAVQQNMRRRVDSYERTLTTVDSEMSGFADKNSIGPLFVALSDKCLDPKSGILAMINPTIALTATSGRLERTILAKRFHIHTLLTCHRPTKINLSQNTNINESMIIATRFDGPKPPTRIVSLDRLPSDENEAAIIHKCISDHGIGVLPDGWGEVSEWPADRIQAGDWSAAAFRSPELAAAAAQFANDEKMLSLRNQGMLPAETGRLLRGKFKISTADVDDSIPILKSKGIDGQLRIEGMPDEHWSPTTELPLGHLISGAKHPETVKLLAKAGYLLVTAGQASNTGRLTAVACKEARVGNGWMPIMRITQAQSKAASVFLNSTAGRLQLMRNPGKKLEFPTYSAKEIANLKIPDLSDTHVCQILGDCWRITASVEVPQYRNGECEVRRLWDEAVALALGWDSDWLSELRLTLHNEPHVRGMGRDQYSE